MENCSFLSTNSDYFSRSRKTYGFPVITGGGIAVFLQQKNLWLSGDYRGE